MRTTFLVTRNPPLTSLASMGIWVSFSKGERKKSHEYTAPTQPATRLLQYHSTQLVLSLKAIIVIIGTTATIVPIHCALLPVLVVHRTTRTVYKI